MEQAIIYRGFERSTEVNQEIERLTPEIGITDCIECGGSGIWSYGYSGEEVCNECKGTGKIMVNF